MKKTIFSLAFSFVSLGLQAKDPKTTQDTFKVWGNCGMCEKRIESAASKVKGVKTADWDEDKGIMILTYDPSQTTPEHVQKAIAAAGYDTEMVKAEDNTYSKLPGCCQYKRKG